MQGEWNVHVHVHIAVWTVWRPRGQGGFKIRMGWTYTGSRIMRKQAMNIIKCTHHHFLKWAPRRAPKLFLVGVGVMWDSSSTNSGFADDIFGTVVYIRD